jgi:hypothetical protein
MSIIVKKSNDMYEKVLYNKKVNYGKITLEDIYDRRF